MVGGGYDTFWTQWTVGTAEFSDKPMSRPLDEDSYYEFFKTKHTTKYLESYVNTNSYFGQTLHDVIRFSIEVNPVLKTDSNWTVLAQEWETGLQLAFKTPRLIIASGLTLIPNMPLLSGRDNFQGQVLHQIDFGSSNVLVSPEIQNITILGAGKSSADMAYEAVKAGKTVSWILKATNTTGLGFFLSPKGIGPYKNAFEIGMIRIAGTFSPSSMNGLHWWTNFLHPSKYGVKIMKAFWASSIRKPERMLIMNENASKDLKSCLHTHRGLLNHEEILDSIPQNVPIYCEDVQGFEKDLLRLKAGEETAADAILCGTGWVPSLQFFSGDQCREVGLSHPLSQEPEDEREIRWNDLETKADSKVLAIFLQLANSPPHYHNPITRAPYRPYRNTVPICESRKAMKDLSIVFIGQVGIGNYFTTVECQSLKEEQEKEVALFTTWCRWRHLSSGEEGNNMTFELIGYLDTLLRDLGRSSHRKGWFKDLFELCWARDFRGLKAEFVERYGYDNGE